MRDQSFLQFEDRQSIVPLTRADGGPLATSADEIRAYSPPPRPSLPGYEIEGELGRGGMGMVYKARQVALDRPVALKMILGGSYAGPQERQRFLAEAKAAAAIQHPNIVQVYDLGVHDGLPYIALEYCPGGTLRQRLAGTPLPPREAASLVARLARAMQAAHAAGIIHRDLKPANVLLDASGQPKISDFGLARRLQDDDKLTMSGAVMGTPAYMAPEQAEGRKDITFATDVHALGAILYECLTGRPPFRADSMMALLQEVLHKDPTPPRRLNASVPRDLETICLKCLEKVPGQRYPTAGGLADDLDRWLEGAPVIARKRRGWWPFG
jgi:serine/threonine-protein kinase